MDENEEIIGEQPQSVETSSLEENENGSPATNPAEIEDKAEQSEAERGVPIGKFKSVEDLYQAYNNLQAEFTRKSQRLSLLEKDKTNEMAQSNDLDKQFQMFLSQNQEAFAYGDELKNRVEQNESLKNADSPYEKAWAELLYEKLSAPNKAKEPLVQNLILKDNELKNLVIENYVKVVEYEKDKIIVKMPEGLTPIVMSSSGERVTNVATPKPDTFEQAKRVVLDLLS